MERSIWQSVFLSQFAKKIENCSLTFSKISGPHLPEIEEQIGRALLYSLIHAVLGNLDYYGKSHKLGISGGSRISQRGDNPKGEGTNLLFWQFSPKKLHEIEKKI